MLNYKNFLAVMGCAVGAAVAVDAAAQEAAPPAPAEAFARMPMLRDVSVSPNGERVLAMIRPLDADEYRLTILDNTNNLAPLAAIPQSANVRIRDMFWKRDDMAIVAVQTAQDRYGTETLETRLMSFHPETSAFRSLFEYVDGAPIQIQDNVISTLRDDQSGLLVSYMGETTGFDEEVFRIDVDRRRHKKVQRSRTSIVRWMADANGVVRAGSGVKNQRSPTLIVKRMNDKSEDISHRVADETRTFRFVGFPANREKAFVVSNHETETDALYIYNIETDTIGERLFHSALSDVVGVVQRPSDGAAWGALFAGDDDTVHWFGDNYPKKLLTALQGVLDEDTISIQSFNAAESHAVLFASDENRPGRYYIFDKSTGMLTQLPSQYPELEEQPVGEVIRTSYSARDGLEIPAFITLPLGIKSLDAASDLPFVVLPHGGPNARDFAGFDWETQFLASRGYGVLQMNFRGSTGYGQSFRDAGDRQWGQTMQDDITDGANWIASTGVADPDRLAIVGHSYGGYAALMGAVKTPDLYQCSVAHAPVTDLPELIRDARQYVNGEYSTRFIGRLWGDRGMLRENSPALHADKIKVPVLLVHGENDRVVTIDQSERMRRGLERKDATFEYVKLANGTHHLDVAHNRLIFLKKLESFLAGCIG